MLKRLTKKWLWDKNSEQGPPDLEEMIKKFFGKKKKDNSGTSTKDDNESKSGRR